MKLKPNIPFENGIEQVCLKDNLGEQFYIDHYNRKTLLSLESLEYEAPFPYPSWRSVLLPQGWCFYSFNNDNYFMNLLTNQITIEDPRTPNERIPFYSKFSDLFELHLKINCFRGIPILNDKAPCLIIQFEDYDLKEKIQKHLLIKTQDYSFEPEILCKEIILKSNQIKNRMNIVFKIFEKGIFSDTNYGYVNIDFYRSPPDVRITDWFPIVGNGTDDCIGMGEMNVTFYFKNISKPNDNYLFDVNNSCISSLNSLYFAKTKMIQNILKNEEKLSTKYKKFRKYEENIDFHYYTPFILPEKVYYLRQYLKAKVLKEQQQQPKQN